MRDTLFGIGLLCFALAILGCATGLIGFGVGWFVLAEAARVVAIAAGGYVLALLFILISLSLD